MSQTHSRSRTDLDNNYQGGLRGVKKKKSSFFSKLLRTLRFIILWGGLIALGFLYYQERLWNSALESQQSGYMTLIYKLVKDSTAINKSQKRSLMDAVRANKLKRCYLLRPIISIKCIK